MVNYLLEYEYRNVAFRYRYTLNNIVIVNIISISELQDYIEDSSVGF